MVCSVCGARRDADSELESLAWVQEKERGRASWLCPRCATRHVRDIESKLPSEYW